MYEFGLVLAFQWARDGLVTWLYHWWTQIEGRYCIIYLLHYPLPWGTRNSSAVIQDEDDIFCSSVYRSHCCISKLSPSPSHHYNRLVTWHPKSNPGKADDSPTRHSHLTLQMVYSQIFRFLRVYYHQKQMMAECLWATLTCKTTSFADLARTDRA